MNLYVVTGPNEFFPLPIVCASKAEAVIAARAGGQARKRGAVIEGHRIEGKGALAAFVNRILAGDLSVTAPVLKPGPRDGRNLPRSRGA